MGAPTKGPPRRQGAETRAKLLDAAVPALAEKGYHATRVDDIVRLAGVSHGTFYLYFANKEGLFRTLAERCADDAAALASSLGVVDPGPAGVATLRAWLTDFLAFYRRYGVVIRAWAENQVTDRTLALLGAAAFERITATLRASMAAGSGDGGAGPDDAQRRLELRAAALLAMIERFAYVTTSRNVGFGEDALLDNLALVVHRGFFRRPLGHAAPVA
ncbi:MAG TPA: TetR/AcrR family transcriptional regulator [Acidimicrobiales bacterium]|nr:TetR/AcrR family transcriptional regulator [Acidimicrobiales bacterium]